MTLDAKVLRALLRLARRRQEATWEAVAIRSGGSPRDVRAALRRLRAGGLVTMRSATEPSLTLAGLAVAVALLPAKIGSPSLTRRPSRAA
jgi:DNA-binding transcriptional ArsR family regulator